MSRPENINSKTGNPNFYKLSNSLDDGGVGHTRQKLENWWKIERKFDHLLINISEKERRLHN